MLRLCVGEATEMTPLSCSCVKTCLFQEAQHVLKELKTTSHVQNYTLLKLYHSERVRGENVNLERYLEDNRVIHHLFSKCLNSVSGIQIWCAKLPSARICMQLNLFCTHFYAIFWRNVSSPKLRVLLKRHSGQKEMELWMNTEHSFIHSICSKEKVKLWVMKCHSFMEHLSIVWHLLPQISELQLQLWKTGHRG